MKNRINVQPARNGDFLRIGLATALVLLVPLIAMQFTSEVNWNATDFLAMGILMPGTVSLIVLASRWLPRRQAIIAAIVLTVAFLLTWAELAAGIFPG
jgi:hypothetical protein